MLPPSFIRLAHRGILTVAGPDARGFLQGLLSNDVSGVDATRACHAALLTPQGKFLFDVFVSGDDDRETLRLDAEAARLAELERRLKAYRLRSRVTIGGDPGFAVFALVGAGAGERLGLSPDTPGAAVPFAGGAVFVDPRLAALGLRAVLPDGEAEAAFAKLGFDPLPVAAYDRLRLSLGVPDGSRDLVVDKSILLECGFDELNGVDFNKGCYVGQELTARTKYRALIKKRLVPVAVDGPLPPPGTPVTLGEQTVGEVRSGQDDRALALVRLEPLAAVLAGDGRLTAGDARLTPEKPAWMAF
jgi:folate-binding protein YgfZ